MKLNVRQSKFITEFIKDFNGTRAYKVAYKSVKSDEVARVNASRLLQKANVQNEVAKATKKLQERVLITQEEIMNELIDMGFGRKRFTSTNFDGNDIEAVPTIPQRRAALELLGKQLGMFNDRIDLTISDKVVIVDDVNDKGS